LAGALLAEKEEPRLARSQETCRPPDDASSAL
jgi:hypothetical protein